jgi:hypothetical protein
MLLESHNPYKPAVISWPKLDADALARLTNLPIWDLAVQTEGFAGKRIDSYCGQISDALLREAVSMMAAEEASHKEVLHNMVRSYGIALRQEPVYTAAADVEWGL